MGRPPRASYYRATDGAAYEIFLGRWTRRLAEPLLDFADFRPGAPLLDVGCGTGSLARTMAARRPGQTVLGIDIASPYVKFAQSQPATAKPAFAVADASRLPLADRSCAGAAAQLVLNFVSDAAAAVREMRRVTRPGGRLVAAVWDFRGGLVYQRMFWDTAAGIDDTAAATRDRLFSGPLALPDGLVRLFEAADLDAVERASITVRMDYRDFADYWQPLGGGQGPVGTYLAGLSEETRGRIEEAVRGAYLSGSPDGPRSMTATAWAVRGQVR